MGKGCDSQLIYSYAKCVCRETGETRSPSINVKSLSTDDCACYDKDIPAKNEINH